MKIIQANKKIKCLGPCPYEPVTALSGTLADGTTYLITGATAVSVNGDITFPTGSGFTVVTSAPTDITVTNATDVVPAYVVWSLGSIDTSFITTGEDWIDRTDPVYGIGFSGQTAMGTINLAAQDPWGEIETLNSSQITINSIGGTDAYRFLIKPLGKCEQPICDVVETLCEEIDEITNVAPEYAEIFFDQQDIHPDDGGGVVGVANPAEFSSDTLEGGWSRTANVVSYSGKVKKITADINMRAQDTDVSNYWSRPSIRVTETVSGRVFWFNDLVMQDNTAYDGSAYYSGSFVHLIPPANPVYLFEYYNEENRTATLIPDVDSSVVMTACNQ